MENQEKILALISDLEKRGCFYVFDNREDLVEGRTDWESLKDTADSFYHALIEIRGLANSSQATCTLAKNQITPVEKESLLSKLCWYDPRNPNYDKENGEQKKDCHCDNCFYGRASLAENILKLLGE